jgi:hypothetical protein
VPSPRERGEREEEDDRRGRAVSGRVREGERARCRAVLPGRVAGPRLLLGRASTWAAREGERERTGEPRVAGTSRRRRKGRPEMKFLFFFLKNVNSISFCLFH